MSAKIIIIGLFSIALVEGLGFGADCANKHSNCNAGLGCNQYLDANNNAKYICSTTCTVANEVAQCGKAGTCLAFNDADKIARNICDIASRKSVCPVVPCSSGTCNTLTLTCTGTGVVVTTKGPVVVNPGCGDLANNCAQLKAGGYCTHASYIALMKTQCALSCGFGCTAVVITVTTTKKPSAGCVNIATNCASLGAYCTNPVYVDLLRTQCRLSCGYC